MKNDYFGLNRVLSIILAIIPFTSWLFGSITRIQEGKLLAGIIRLVFGFTVLWILDLVCMVMNNQIVRIL